MLSKKAQAEWRRIVPELQRAGILTRLDRTTLALYCQAYSDYVESLEMFEKPWPTTPLFETKNKNVVQHPALSIRNKAFKTLVSIAAEFGLSPSSRSKIEVTENTPANSGRKAAPFKVA